MNSILPVSGFTPQQRIDRLVQARTRLRALIEHLPEDGWLGPRAEHLNPPLWEFGHIVWFQERWCLRALPDGSLAASRLNNADALYDSSAVPHDSRWSLPLPNPAAVDDYAAEVAAAVSARLLDHADPALAYFAELSLYHELMHIEAWWMAFQNLGYAPPYPLHTAGYNASPARTTCAAADVELGSRTEGGFVFDNEKWSHPVRIPAFDIDTHAVSETSFAAFVDAGGYQARTLWSDAGWAWRTASDAAHPLYWRKADGGWQARRFADWMSLRADAPMLHVNRFEAEACAAWLGRRLPSAAQWQHATTQAGFSWGVCWEWTRDAFLPYPGFAPDPYRDYSQPWFGSHTELRGGGPVTDPLLKRPGFRNFYLPYRRDPFAGFRTVSPAAAGS